jgi:hypothetical protein
LQGQINHSATPRGKATPQSCPIIALSWEIAKKFFAHFALRLRITQCKRLSTINTMKRNNDLTYLATRLMTRLLFLSMLAAEVSSFGQGTAFTYQGRLTDNGSPGNTNYDLSFALYDAGTGGSLVGSRITNNAVAVSAGLFTTTLDFGAGVFTGAPLWLEIGVAQRGSGTFHILAPRQALTPAPYAIYAGSGPVGGVWSLNGTSAYYNAGNVGIGTSAPAEKLTIAGVGSFSTGLKLTGSATAGTGLSLENTSAGGHKFDLFSGASAVSVGPGGFAIFDETAAAYRFAINSNGKVGIGTATPAAGLDVYGEWDGVNGALTLHGTEPSLRMNGGLVEGSWLIQGSPDGLEFFTKQFIDPNFSMVMSLTPAGYLGLGVTNPAENLTIGGVAGYNNGLKLSGSSTGGAGMAIQCTAAGGHTYALFSAGSGDGVGAGGFGIFDDSAAAYRIAIQANGFVGIGKANPTTLLDINGTTTTKVLTITGGSDLAEPFQISGERQAEGSVVIIDEENPGQLKLSNEPYDRRVAGIVSGANGVHPGISLQQTGLVEGGQNVALSGRVYVLADATAGSIKPGDLLTTSATPGHAMKVANHAKAQGAILGKAMSGLKEGKGMVLVLVTLE